jgi:hypothetical protein
VNKDDRTASGERPVAGLDSRLSRKSRNPKTDTMCSMGRAGSREFGDFQTPAALVRKVLQCCGGEAGTAWTRALEPTCGGGAFIAGLLRLETPPLEIWGIEVQRTHVDACSLIGQGFKTAVRLRNASVFELDLGADLAWSASGPLLVVGNPPWVTSAELGSLGSANLPAKRNIKGLAGLDAITGAANFDIAEYIWLKLLTELAAQEPLIALLCKTTVARNVLQFAWKRGVPIESGFLRRLDAQAWFGAAVDACLFGLRLRTGAASYRIPVFAGLEANVPESVMAVENGRLIADVDAYRSSSFADGRSQFTWRQGVKHDASPVMELDIDPGGGLRNQRGELVAIEADFVYPVMKSSDLFTGGQRDRRVIVPQRSLGEDTRRLRHRAPALWDYLTRNQETFDRRRSSIYRRQPPFAVFGIGAYSFTDFKVAVSGLYKQPRFRAVGPRHGRPVLFDDTCYFTSCRNAAQAALVAALLSSDAAQSLLRALMFTDAKRPVTKALLQRVDLRALVRAARRRDLIAAADGNLTSLGAGPEAWPADLEALLQ